MVGSRSGSDSVRVVPCPSPRVPVSSGPVERSPAYFHVSAHPTTMSNSRTASTPRPMRSILNRARARAPDRSRSARSVPAFPSPNSLRKRLLRLAEHVHAHYSTRGFRCGGLEKVCGAGRGTPCGEAPGGRRATLRALPGAVCGYSTKGSMSATPKSSKSRTFRVAISAPRQRAMAAIWPSTTLSGRPLARR